MPAPSGWPRKVAALPSKLFMSVGRSDSSSGMPYIFSLKGGCGSGGEKLPGGRGSKCFRAPSFNSSGQGKGKFLTCP